MSDIVYVALLWLGAMCIGGSLLVALAAAFKWLDSQCEETPQEWRKE